MKQPTAAEIRQAASTLYALNRLEGFGIRSADHAVFSAWRLRQEADRLEREGR